MTFTETIVIFRRNGKVHRMGYGPNGLEYLSRDQFKLLSREIHAFFRKQQKEKENEL